MSVPAIVIGSIALVLTLVQIGYAAWRRFIRRPEFRVQSAMAVIDKTLAEGSPPQVIFGEIQLAVIALGGGQAESIVDSYVALRWPTPENVALRWPTPGLSFDPGIVIVGPAIEIGGEKAIPIPADVPTKFSQTFPAGTLAGFADKLNCQLILDVGYRTYHADFALTRHGDAYEGGQRF